MSKEIYFRNLDAVFEINLCRLYVDIKTIIRAMPDRNKKLGFLNKKGKIYFLIKNVMNWKYSRKICLSSFALVLKTYFFLLCLNIWATAGILSYLNKYFLEIYKDEIIHLILILLSFNLKLRMSKYVLTILNSFSYLILIKIQSIFCFWLS